PATPQRCGTGGERGQRPAPGLRLAHRVEVGRTRADLERRITHLREDRGPAVREAPSVAEELGLGDAHARARAAREQQPRDPVHHETVPSHAMDVPTARARLGHARVGELATVRSDGTAHVVPVCFALLEGTVDTVDTVVTAVDAKPKSTAALRRL